MNAITQRNRLDATIKSYMHFMPFCPRDSFIKLSNEMIKISERLEAIKCMGAKELMAPVEVQYDTKQSRANFINYEIPTAPSSVEPEKIYNYKSVKKTDEPIHF